MQHAYQALMREGVSQGGGKSLPLEYRPDRQMFDEFYRALIRWAWCCSVCWTILTKTCLTYSVCVRLHECELQLGEPEVKTEGSRVSHHRAPLSLLARDLSKDLEEAMNWSRMSAHVPSASVYGQLLR